MIQTPTGPDLHLAQHRRAGRHVVFLHFLGGSAREWDGVVAALPSDLRALAIDLPGFGEAASLTGYDVSAMREHVGAEIVAHVGTDDVVLVGHSMGGKVALALARRAADRPAVLPGLRGLVLVAGSPPAPEPMTDDKRATMLSWFAGPAPVGREHAERFIADNVGRELPVAVHEQAVEDVLRTHPDAWTAWLQAGSREDWVSRIGHLAVPTLIVTGQADEGLGEDAQRRLTLPHLHNARIESITGAGHLLPMEVPDRLAQLIVSHWREIETSAAVPPAYGALIRSDRVGAATRDALLARTLPDPEGRDTTLPPELMPTLRALLDRVVPQANHGRIDLAARIDRLLADPLGDGWRFDALPADREAWTAGLHTLNAEAGSQGFAVLMPDAQDALLTRVADGALDRRTPPLLDAAQMRFWFEDVRSAATRLYVSHPATLARIGYSGIANGGDGERLVPWVLIGEGEREPWEPMAEIAR